MQMPVMDGLMLAEEIRRYCDEQTLPLVMLSSLGRPQKDPRLDEFAATLTKPVKASQLYNTLMEVAALEISQVQMRRTQDVAEAESEFDMHMGKQLPLRILLAEDNTINQQLASLMLERLGYRADVAGNGLEAIDALQRQPYDVILMDVQMPEMDGLAATRHIRQLSPEKFCSGGQPYIIAMTANAMQGDRETCLAVGMDDYISKPIEVRKLIGALSKCKPSREAASPDTSTKPETTPLEEADETMSPAAEANSDAVLDPVALKRLQATLGKQAATMLPVLIDTFFKDAVKLQTDARQALAQGQLEELRRAAHTLKSNSANFGAQTLAALCQELENRAKEGELEDAEALLTQIEVEYKKARTALEAI
jgi:CheY-like chemotaxis protein